MGPGLVDKTSMGKNLYDEVESTGLKNKGEEGNGMPSVDIPGQKGGWKTLPQRSAA